MPPWLRPHPAIMTSVAPARQGGAITSVRRRRRARSRHTADIQEWRLDRPLIGVGSTGGCNTPPARAGCQGAVTAVRGFQEKELRAGQCGYRIVDLTVQENDSLAQKPRKMSKDRSPRLDCSTTIGTSCIASRMGERLSSSFAVVGSRRQAARMRKGQLSFAAICEWRSSRASTSPWMIPRRGPALALRSSGRF